MVRLEDSFFARHDGNQKNFNSSMVRLEGYVDNSYNVFQKYFNSSMVRLEGSGRKIKVWM